MIDICEHLEGVARQLVEENGLKSGGGGAGGGAQVRWGRGSGKLGVGLKSDVWGSSQMGVKLEWVRLKSVGVGLKPGTHGLVCVRLMSGRGGAAAHFTPNAGDTTVLEYDDVCKIDFGTHVSTVGVVRYSGCG